jgi:hypothetical protein
LTEENNYDISVDNIELTSGTLFNLDNGIMYSNEFKLFAGDKDGYLKLNSNPSLSEYYFDVGNSDSFLRLKSSGAIEIQANSSSGSFININSGQLNLNAVDFSFYCDPSDTKKEYVYTSGDARLALRWSS